MNPRPNRISLRGVTRPPSVLFTALAFAGLSVACDSLGPSRPPGPGNTRRSRDKPVVSGTADGSAGFDWLAGDAGLLEQPAAPLSGALAACVARVTRGIPPELAAALQAVEYPSIAEDGCRLDLAVAGHDPALCAHISVSTVRNACLWRTAIVTGAIDDCPASLGDRGRDPICVALASRNAGLCAATRSFERVRCMAIARLDEARCNTVDPLLRAPCHRDVAALRAHLTPHSESVLPAGTAHLRVTFDPSTDAGQVREYDLDVLARGAYITAARTLYLVDPARGWPTEGASSLFDHVPIIGFTLDVPARVGYANVRDLRVILPDGLDLRPISAGSFSVGSAQLTQIGTSRGRSIAGTVTATASASGLPVRVELEFHTFIRDVVEPAVVAAR